MAVQVGEAAAAVEEEVAVWGWRPTRQARQTGWLGMGVVDAELVGRAATRARANKVMCVSRPVGHVRGAQGREHGARRHRVGVVAVGHLPLLHLLAHRE